MTNNSASTNYGNGEVLAGDIIPDRLSLEAQELSLDNPLSHILTSSRLNSSNRSREVISDLLLEKEDLVLPLLKRIENSEITQEISAESKPIDLITKALQGRSFSTEDLVSLAIDRKPAAEIEPDNLVGKEASISHLTYGCCCPGCGENSSSTKDNFFNTLSREISALPPPPDDDPPPPPPTDDPANEVYQALYEVVDRFRPLWLPNEYRLWNNLLGQPVTVSYSFLQSVPSYYDDDAKERNNFAPFTPDQMNGARRALQVDRIEDFGNGPDHIVLDKTVFSSLKSNGGIGFTVFGFSEASEFAIVSSDAEVAASRALIVYSKATGNLFYNQNSTNADLGSGGLFATLANSPDLTAEDFVLTI